VPRMVHMKISRSRFASNALNHFWPKEKKIIWCAPCAIFHCATGRHASKSTFKESAKYFRYEWSDLTSQVTVSYLPVSFLPAEERLYITAAREYMGDNLNRLSYGTKSGTQNNCLAILGTSRPLVDSLLVTESRNCAKIGLR
jgi:hypothetical protein